jgi:hypothetical protein
MRYRIVAAAALAWTGMYIHNVADLPHLTLASPENLIPGLIWLLLLGLWWTMPGRGTTYLLMGWGLLNLVGGFATVLPLPIWPFRPEQSLRHYGFHVLYALTQLPLLALISCANREDTR